MSIFAFIVFVVHTLFELAFGFRAYITGGSSSATPEQIEQQTAQETVAARFLGSALTGLGVLGAVILIGPGAASTVAKYVSLGFAVFHILGAIGILYAARRDRSVLAPVLTRGALCVHTGLGVCFLVLVLVLPGY